MKIVCFGKKKAKFPRRAFVTAMPHAPWSYTRSRDLAAWMLSGRGLTRQPGAGNGLQSRKYKPRQKTKQRCSENKLFVLLRIHNSRSILIVTTPTTGRRPKRPVFQGTLDPMFHCLSPYCSGLRQRRAFASDMRIRCPLHESV